MTHTQKYLPQICVLSQTNPVLTIISCLPKTHFNIMPHFTNSVYPSVLPTSTLYSSVTSLTHVTAVPISPPLLDLTAVIQFSDNILLS